MSQSHLGRQELRAPLTDVRAVLFHDGEVETCELLNLSAGGMLVSSTAVLAPGSEVTLGLRLSGDLAATAGVDYLSFQVEVLESVAGRPEDGPGAARYRLRNLTSEGSELYERARSLVYQALRTPAG